MKVVTPIVTMAVATAVTSTLLLAASAPEDVAIKPSPGVTAEQLIGDTLGVQPAGYGAEFLPEFGIGAGAGHGLKGKDRGNRMPKKPRRGVGGCSGGGCRKINYIPGDIIIQPADHTSTEVGIGSAAGKGLDNVVTIQWVGSTEEYPEMIGRGAGKKIKKSVRAGGRGPRQPNHNR